MNASGCCGTGEEMRQTRGSGGLPRRAAGFLRWLLPGAVLVVVPKCPMCFAAWIAVGTGLGVSVATAAYLRWALVVMCVVSLLAMVAGRWILLSKK